MRTPYSRDGKWLWTGQEWVALPPGPEPEPPPPNPKLRLVLGLTGLLVTAGALVTVSVTIVQNL